MQELLLNNKNEQIVIPLSKLRPSALNTFNADDYADLANSIRNCGLLTPLTVIGPDDNGYYEILSGERRYRAITSINSESPGFMEDVPCYAIGGPDMSETCRKLVIELSNLEVRDDFNRDAHRFHILELLRNLADEDAAQVQNALTSTTVSKATLLARAMKTSKRYGRMYASVFQHGSQALIDAVKSEDPAKHVPISVASRIAQIPKEQQDEIIARSNNGEKALSVFEEITQKNRGSDSQEDEGFDDLSPLAEEESLDRPFYDGDDEDYEDEASQYEQATTPSYPHSSQSHPASGSAPARTPGLPQDELLYQQIETGEDFDIDQFDAMGAFRRMRNSDPVNVEIDTTGRIRTLKSSEDSKTKRAEERRIVGNWIDRMLKVINSGASVDPEDVSLIEEFTLLADRYSQVS